MKRHFFVGLFTFAALILSGCGIFGPMASEPEPTDEESEIVVQTDTQTLAQYVELARLPEFTDVRWVQQRQGVPDSRVPGPTDYTVASIFEFDESAEDVIAGLGLAARGDVYIEDALFNVLPPEVQERFVRTPEGYLRFDGTAYAPDSLLLPPLNSGYALAVDNILVVFGATT